MTLSDENIKAETCESFERYKTGIHCNCSLKDMAEPFAKLRSLIKNSLSIRLFVRQLIQRV